MRRSKWRLCSADTYRTGNLLQLRRFLHSVLWPCYTMQWPRRSLDSGRRKQRLCAFCCGCPDPENGAPNRWTDMLLSCTSVGHLMLCRRQPMSSNRSVWGLSTPKRSLVIQSHCQLPNSAWLMLQVLSNWCSHHANMTALSIGNSKRVYFYWNQRTRENSLKTMAVFAFVWLILFGYVWNASRIMH